MEKLDLQFNKNDYLIERSTSEVCNSLNQEIIEKNEYIDLKFKIGDYYTSCGYVILLENNKLKAVYKNIDDEIRKELLQRKDEFINSLTEKEIGEIISKELEKKRRR